MMHKHKVFISAILMFICLNGCYCASVPTAPLYDTLEQSVEQTAAPAAKPKAVGVYIDVTPSMKGFLNHPYSTDDTCYSQCLNKMGALIAGSYDQITYYRVDTPLWRVDGDEDVLERARNQSYYVDSKKLSDGNYTQVIQGNGYDSLCLTPALEEGRNQDLSILITDLYENSTRSSTGKNTNVNALTRKILALAGLDDGKVFGLIGIKSEFSGSIYDTGSNGEIISYGEDQLAYRPFYILLQGYPEYVQDFCQHMERCLKELSKLKSEDYEITVFYGGTFTSLDYTSFKECANFVTSPAKKKSLWLDDATVIVSSAEDPEDTKNLPVYGYQKNTADTFGGTLYFAYSIDRMHQEQFHTLAERIGERSPTYFLPSGETEMYTLPCLAQALTASCWDENDGFVQKKTGNLFDVCGLYYNQDTETLYAALCLEDAQLTKGIWRFQWKNVVEGSWMDTNPWWEQWHTPSGENADYSKTERLAGYIEPIQEKAFGSEQCILNAVVYLNIEDG